MKKLIFLFITFTCTLNLFTQSTFFDEIEITNFDSISENERNIINKRQLAYQSCSTDTCRLRQLYAVGNLVESLEIQKKICKYSLFLISKNLELTPLPPETEEIIRYKVMFLSGLASTSMDGGNFTNAIDFLSKSIEVAKEIKDTLLMIEGYNNLGYVNYTLEDVPGSNKFYLKAINLAEKAELKGELPSLYLNVFSSYGVMDSLDLALVYANKFFNLGKESIDPQLLLIASNNLAGFYKDRVKNNDSAFHYYTKTISLAKELNNIEALYISKSIRAKLFEEQDNLEETEQELEEVLEICLKMEDKTKLKETYNRLYLIKERLGKYQEALEYRNKQIEIKNQEGKKEDIQSLSDLEANLKYENELILKEEKAQSLEKESKLKSRIITISIISLVLIALSLLFLALNRKKLNQSRVRLEELDKVNKQIFSVIAHDFKEPIVNFNSLLGHISNKKSIDGEFVSELESQVKSSSDVLNNLLNWARVELEKQEVIKKNLNLEELWNKVVSNMEVSIKKKNIHIKNLISPNETIEADSVMMEIVFRNLLSNAVKYSPEGGEITLTTSKNGVEIIDQGTGIKTNDQEALFKEKVNPEYGTKGEIGFGIGLFIVKNLLEKNGKSISFYSNNPKGTIFAIQDL